MRGEQLMNGFQGQRCTIVRQCQIDLLVPAGVRVGDQLLGLGRGRHGCGTDIQGLRNHQLAQRGNVPPRPGRGLFLHRLQARLEAFDDRLKTAHLRFARNLAQLRHQIARLLDFQSGLADRHIAPACHFDDFVLGLVAGCQVCKVERLPIQSQRREYRLEPLDAVIAGVISAHQCGNAAI